MAAIWALLAVSGPAAALTCIHSWAVPGTYIIEGDFRGQDERATAKLNNACRVVFNLPGVYSGGPVRQAGNCLNFDFKVQNDPTLFTATWCGARATVPWQGRDVEATVYRLAEPQAAR